MTKSYYQLAQENIEKSSKALKLYELVKDKVKYNDNRCSNNGHDCNYIRESGDGFSYNIKCDLFKPDSFFERCKQCIDIFGK